MGEMGEKVKLVLKKNKKSIKSKKKIIYIKEFGNFKPISPST